MRLVHLKTGHFGEKNLTSYTAFFLITRIPIDEKRRFLACDILMMAYSFNLRHERASSSKYFQSSYTFNNIICKPAVVLVFKWPSLTWCHAVTLWQVKGAWRDISNTVRGQDGTASRRNTMRGWYGTNTLYTSVLREMPRRAVTLCEVDMAQR